MNNKIFNRIYQFILIIFLTTILGQSSYAQCRQNHSNSLFSAKQFLSFTGNVGECEELLLAWDFCLVETRETTDGSAIYYDYRLDHTLKININIFLLDSYAVTDDVNRFDYYTSSNKNLLAYKNKLIKYGFVQVEGVTDYYVLILNDKKYHMNLSRKVNKGTPVYKISIHMKHF